MGKNIVFCGYGQLAMECLTRLIKEGHSIMYVLTHKDENNSIVNFCKFNNILFSYKDARKENMLQNMETNLDYVISVNYRYILPKYFFEKAKHAINIHGSLLPKYRGRTPHVWSIINGEQYSGVTCHLIEETVDTGNIVEQVKIKIDPNDTGHSLLQKFGEIYPEILMNSIKKLELKVDTMAQDESQASFYGKRTPNMGYIDFYKPQKKVIDFVRAQAYPYPGAYYYLIDGTRIIINGLECHQKEDVLLNSIGVIKKIDDSYYVRCSDALLKIVDYVLK